PGGIWPDSTSSRTWLIELSTLAGSPSNVATRAYTSPPSGQTDAGKPTPIGASKVGGEHGGDVFADYTEAASGTLARSSASLIVSLRPALVARAISSAERAARACATSSRPSVSSE